MADTQGKGLRYAVNAIDGDRRERQIDNVVSAMASGKNLKKKKKKKKKVKKKKSNK